MNEKQATFLVTLSRNSEKAVELKQMLVDSDYFYRESTMSILNPPKLPDFNDPVAAARAWADAKEQELKAKPNNKR